MVTGTESLDEATGLGLIALAHFVDELDRLLQQRHLRAHRVEQALLRVGARRLRLERRAALADRLIDRPAGSSAARRRPADRARRCRCARSVRAPESPCRSAVRRPASSACTESTSAACPGGRAAPARSGRRRARAAAAMPTAWSHQQRAAAAASHMPHAARVRPGEERGRGRRLRWAAAPEALEQIGRRLDPIEREGGRPNASQDRRPARGRPGTPSRWRSTPARSAGRARRRRTRPVGNS